LTHYYYSKIEDVDFATVSIRFFTAKADFQKNEEIKKTANKEYNASHP